jgi:glycyl-tRNA synthetase
VSKKDLSYFDEVTKQKYVPYVIESSVGVGRMFMAVMCNYYREDTVGESSRVYLAFPFDIAPVKLVVSPLLRNKPELVEKAREVYRQLKKKYGSVLWDDNGNIGKRYRRADEIGVPKCITVDFQTIEDGTVTQRDRDTTEQTRIAIDQI